MLKFRRNVIELDDAPELDRPPKTVMTETEFVAWAYAAENVRAEWEGGKVIVMAPVSIEEDDLNGWLLAVLRNYVEEHDLGIVKGPQFMIRLGRQRRRRMPDLMFVAKSRQHLLTTNHLEGAPDIAFEIVSTDSQTRDRRKKFLEYEKAGVKEYWIVDPHMRHTEVYVLQRGRFTELAEQDGAFRSAVIKGFFLRADWFWRRPLPKLSQVARELGIR